MVEKKYIFRFCLCIFERETVKIDCPVQIFRKMMKYLKIKCRLLTRFTVYTGDIKIKRKKRTAGKKALKLTSQLKKKTPVNQLIEKFWLDSKIIYRYSKIVNHKFKCIRYYYNLTTISMNLLDFTSEYQTSVIVLVNKYII